MFINEGKVKMKKQSVDLNELAARAANIKNG